MRRKKNLNDRLKRVSSLIVENPTEKKGSWAEHLGSKPIHLEIGCGKGKFICDMAEANPDIFYIAMEKVAMSSLRRSKWPSRITFKCPLYPRDAALLSDISLKVRFRDYISTSATLASEPSS